MAIVTTVTYVFNVNGDLTQPMVACRGIRQGEPISPLLFVLMMEYLSRLLSKMQMDQNFNFHAKCEKHRLSNLIFVDDVLLFCRGDIISDDMILSIVKLFSLSTGLVMNPQK